MEKIELRKAIMSHLSDAQELISLGYPSHANKEVNFVKTLIQRYDDLSVELDELDLDDAWNDAEKLFNN